MVALHIPGAAAHLRGIGERGRIAEDQVPAVVGLALVANPCQHVIAYKVVVGAGKAVLAHVALRPIQIGVGKVDSNGFFHACVGGVAGGGAGVGKQVEEPARLLGMLSHQATRNAVV